MIDLNPNMWVLSMNMSGFNWTFKTQKTSDWAPKLDTMAYCKPETHMHTKWLRNAEKHDK